MPKICVRTISTEDKPISIITPTYGNPVEPITSFAQLPAHGPVILYIVAHAVPNGLRTIDGAIITEVELAEQLQYRAGQPTLIIFDACFAKSFSNIPGFTWPAKFGLIFSCLEHERTWSKDVGQSRQSIFSEEFDKAMTDCLERRSFSGLQNALTEAFGGLQTPSVEANDELLREIFGMSAIKAA